MGTENIYRYLQVDDQSITPKYLQLTNSFLRCIESGKIEKAYPLPSINDLSYELDVSRDTAEKTYRNLKKMGIIGSIPGKGYLLKRLILFKSLKFF